MEPRACSAGPISHSIDNDSVRLTPFSGSTSEFYFNVNLGASHDNLIATESLFDTGCSVSLIDDRIMQQLIDTGVIFHPIQQNVGTAAAGGTLSVTAYADVLIVFKDTLGNEKSFFDRLFVAEHLIVPFIINNQILLSPATVSITPSSISFTNSFKQLVRIPILERKLSSDRVLLAPSDIIIPPWTTVELNVPLTDSDGKHRDPLPPDRLLLDSLHTSDVYVQQGPLRTSDNLIQIQISNDSSSLIGISEHTEIAHVSSSLCAKVANQNRHDLDSLDDLSQLSDKVNELFLHDLTPSTPQDILSSIDFSNLSQKGQKRFSHLVHKHIAAFARHPMDVGDFSLFKMPITLKKGATPQMAKRRPCPMGLRPKASEMIDQYLEAKIIKESTEPSPFVTNLVFVPKKNGEVRACHDARNLNMNTVRIASSYPTLEEVWSSLYNKSFLSSVDLAHAFFSLAIQPRDTLYTQFYHPTNPSKRYEFLKASMGFVNSAGYLANAVSFAVEGLDLATVYCDDILLASDTEDDHLDLIETFFKRMIQYKFVLKPQKCVIGASKVSFLGFEYSLNTVSISDARIRDFLDVPPPKTRKQLMRFVMSLSYFRGHFQALSSYLAPFKSLLSTNSTFHWCPEHEEAFNTLKTCISNRVVLTVPKPNHPFVLFSDASSFGLGATLMQEFDGVLKIVAVFSKTLSSSQSKEAIVILESDSLLAALRKWEPYTLYAPKITARVDAKCLVFIALARAGNSKFMRRAIALSLFNLEIQHLPGEENHTSDFLSRVKHDPAIATARPLTVQESLQMVNAMSFPLDYVFTVDDTRALLTSDFNLPSLLQRAAKRRTDKDPITVTQKALIKDMLNSQPKGVKPIKRKLLPRSQSSSRLSRNVHPKSAPKQRRTRSASPKPLSSAPLAAPVITRSMTRGDHRNRLAQQSPPLQDRQRDLNPSVSQSQRSSDPPEDDNLSSESFPAKIIKTKIIRDGLVSHEALIAMQQDCAMCIALSKRDNVICKDGLFRTSDDKIIIPISLQKDLLRDAHKTHDGVTVMSRKLNRYFWPGKTEDIANIVKRCAICAYTNKRRRPKPPIFSLFHGEYPLDAVYVDLVNELHHKTALVLVDAFSFYANVYITGGKGVEHVRPALMMYFSNTGTPNLLFSDAERAFRAKEIQALLDDFGVAYVRSSVGHPQSKAVVELFNKHLKRGLSAIMLEHPTTDLDTAVAKYLTAYNNRVHPYSRMGYTITEIFHGGPIATSEKLSLHLAPEPFTTVSDRDKEFERISSCRRQRQEASRSRLNKHRSNQQTFQNGEQVLVHEDAIPARGHSLRPKASGPYVVLASRHSNNTVDLLEPMTGKKKRDIHVSRLYPFIASPVVSLDHVRGLNSDNHN